MIGEPFVVHRPSNWRKLRQLIEHGARNYPPGEFVARYKAKCSGRKVELPPNVKVASDEEGYYFVAGPHDRYYQRCSDCVGGLA